MADERGLDGLDPYDLQDVECDRLARWFGALDDEGWAQASACEGWSRRDLLGHLVAVEEYFTACLGGGVQALMERYMGAGASTLEEFNAAGVAATAAVEPGDLLATWQAANEVNRAGFRGADGTMIDSSIGAYPARLQAFHAAFEYAIHADDVDALVHPAERDGRCDWLAGVGRFALTEVKPEATVELDGEVFVVRHDGAEARVDREQFVAGVSGRAAPGQLSDGERALLGLGY